MALTDKLRDLDQKLLPGTREPDEDAETYLRRVAAGRALSPAQAGDVMAALRVYFDVQPGAGSDDDDDDGEAGDEEQQSESASAGDEKDEAEQDGSDGASEDESDEKADEDES